MISTINAYAKARKDLKKIFKSHGILVNDNHVGTIGELYAKIYLERKGLKVNNQREYKRKDFSGKH